MQREDPSPLGTQLPPSSRCPHFTDGKTDPSEEEGAVLRSRLTWEMALICLSRTLGCLVEEMRGGGLEMVGGRGSTGRTLSWRPRGSG